MPFSWFSESEQGASLSMKLCQGVEVEVAYGPAFGMEDLHLVEVEEGILQEMLTNR